jgi:hypothetical protein
MLKAKAPRVRKTEPTTFAMSCRSRAAWRAPIRLLSALGMWWTLQACGEPVEASSVYESQRFLCSDELASEWAEEVESCRLAFQADRSCGGVVSFEGTLQDQPISVESHALFTAYVRYIDRGVDTRSFDVTALSGCCRR